MNNFTQKFIYKESFDSLLAFTQKIFNEKNIFFEDEDSFWFVRIMVYYLARIFVDNKNKKSDSDFSNIF